MTNKTSPTSTTQAGDTRRMFLTVDKSIIEGATCQAPSPIADLLRKGGSNAMPCRDLVALTGWTPREITRQIQRERATGVPICANGCGYYLPATDAEVDAYLHSLDHRLREVQRTQNAIAQTRQLRMDLGGVVHHE